MIHIYLLFFSVPNIIIIIVLQIRKMSDNPKEAEKRMKKAIFVCNENWLKVFGLLSPRQLGFKIALISRRFDKIVDEHFKTRKWKVDTIRIDRKIGENGAAEMQIEFDLFIWEKRKFCGKVIRSKSYKRKTVPIPNKSIPKSVIGFKCLDIRYIDQNVIAFLRHFRHIFAFSKTLFRVKTKSDRILKLIEENILSNFKANICEIHFLSADGFRRFIPSIFLKNCCPLLRKVYGEFEGIFPEFSSDMSDANASHAKIFGQWLFTPRPDGLPKTFRCKMSEKNWLMTVNKIEALKTAFLNASSPANFILYISVEPHYNEPILPFKLVNNSTGEWLTMKKRGIRRVLQSFVFVRCPIGYDENCAEWQEKILKIYEKMSLILIAAEDDDEQIGEGPSKANSVAAGPSGSNSK